MSSSVYFRKLLYLSVTLAYVTVCEGTPRHKQFVENKDDSEDVGAVVDAFRSPAIQFPSYEEMTSDEREANKVMARKIAKIVEKNIHMVADDVLQIMSLMKARVSHDGDDGDDFDSQDSAQAPKG